MRLFILPFFLLNVLFANTVKNPERRMKADLDFIEAAFEVKYAPLQWKKEYIGFNLSSTFTDVRNKINAKLTTAQFQRLLRGVFNKTADYHAGIYFYSTQSAFLPFTIKSVSVASQPNHRRYFIQYIDRDILPKSLFPCEVGDEVLTWNKEPIHTVVQNLIKEELGTDNSIGTQQALGEMLLTMRQASTGVEVPSDKVDLETSREGIKALHSLYWFSYPERIPPLNRLKKDSTGIISTSLAELSLPLKNAPIFQKIMVPAFWKKSSADIYNPHQLGSKISFLPDLGEKIWQTRDNAEGFFDAYIFKTASGQSIGYVRIAHYMADVLECAEFAQIIKHLQAHTDKLVVDQLNNPGGSVFYLYALANMLSTEPIDVPLHEIALTQEDVYMAAQMLPTLEEIESQDDLETYLGADIGGFPLSLDMVQGMKTFFRSIVDCWSNGELMTRPLPLFGIDRLPGSFDGYSKPILVLVNSLDFSGGDFFPAIMQDNKRATILGEKTAGAGGYVLSTQYPNLSGIESFNLTGSIARRKDNQPLENLGVEPDIHYEMTPEDMQQNYKNFAARILETLEEM
jgi:hypothetical protein